MHEVSEGEIDAIDRPAVLLSYTNELKILDLDNAETDPPENLQDNSATSPVNTQPSPLHSTPEDTLVASAGPPPCPCIEAIEAALQACTRDLPDFCLLGADYMLYGIYQD